MDDLVGDELGDDADLERVVPEEATLNQQLGIDHLASALGRVDGLLGAGQGALRSGIVISLGAAAVFGLGWGVLTGRVGLAIVAFVIGAVPTVGLWLLRTSIGQVREFPRQLVDAGRDLGPDLLGLLKGDAPDGNFRQALESVKIARLVTKLVREGGVVSTVASLSPGRLAFGAFSVVAPPFFALWGALMLALGLMF